MQAETTNHVGCRLHREVGGCRSVHQAPMSFQVIVPTSRRGLECGEIRVGFIARHEMYASPGVAAEREALDADGAPGQAGPDRREGGSPCAVHHVPTGGGRGPASAIPDDSQPDTPLRRNDAEGFADMTVRIDRQTVQRMWCGAISAGIPAEERHRPSHRGPRPPCEEPFLGWAGNRSLGKSGQASTMFIQTPGSVVGWRSTGTSRIELEYRSFQRKAVIMSTTASRVPVPVVFIGFWFAVSQPEPALAEQVLIDTADRQSVTWRYTTDKPAKGWNELSFDDSTWDSGRAGFGVTDHVTPPATVGTAWKTSAIWLRKIGRHRVEDVRDLAPQDDRRARPARVHLGRPDCSAR